MIQILEVLVHTETKETHTHMIDRCYLQTAILLKYIENEKKL